MSVNFVARAGERIRHTRAFIALLWRTSPGIVIGLCLLTVVRALLPAGIILATGMLVAAIPAAVTNGLGSADGSRALVALGLIGLAFFASGLGDALNGYAQELLGGRFVIAVTDKVAAATARPPGIAALEDPAIAGELAAIEEYDRERVFSRAVQSLQYLLHMRIQGIAAFAILLGFRWWAPLVILLAWRVFDHAFARTMVESSQLVHHQRGTGLRRAQYLRSLAVEPSAAKEVRVFGLGGWVVGQYARTWLAAMPEIWRQRRASWPAILVAGGVLVLAQTGVLGAIGWAAWTGELTVAAMVVFTQAVLACDSQGPLDYQQWILSQAFLGAYRVTELEDRLGTGPAPPASPASHGSGPVAVRLEDVRFTYPGQATPTLDGMNLEIPAGQSLAIVGANGAGKTTLIKLLCGFYVPDAGSVMVDGTTDLTAARTRLAVIFQDFVRYQLPLRANVGFGRLAIADDADALEAALRDAGGGDLLTSLPDGWDSVLAAGYDNGVELSGGQWQKVALARALLAVRGGAGLLVLDEPTAHMDVRAEAKLFNQFLELTRQATTVLVSHRLSSVRHADRIVLLADGKVAEDGTHEQLMTAGGQYASMYALQAERFVTGPAAEGMDGEVAADA